MNTAVSSLVQPKSTSRRSFPPKLSVSVLVEYQGMLLMVQEASQKHYGLWTQPQGMIDPGEMPQDAAIREVLEESGLEVRLLNEFGTYSDPGDPYIINFCFRARPVTLTLRPKDPKEILQAKFFHKEEVARFDEARWRSPLAKMRAQHWLTGDLSVGHVRMPSLT